MFTNDNKCDYCNHRIKNKCDEVDTCKCNHPYFECCDDNLKKNVGEICFKYNVSQNTAVAIIKILEKERERNECLYVHREYIEESGNEECRNNHRAEIHSSREPQDKG